MAPDVEVGLLENLLGLRRVAQHAHDETEDAGARVVVQLRERSVITSRAALDEFLSAHRST